MINKLSSVKTLVLSFQETLARQSMRNFANTIENDSDKVLDTVSAALPRLHARNTMALAILIASDDTHPLIVSYQHEHFAILNMATELPLWKAVDAGKIS